MSSSAAANAQRVVGGFASLLSSALAMNGENGVEPLKDSSGTLPRFISPSVPGDSICCIVPSFLLKHSNTSYSNEPSLEEAAALNLARPLALTREELQAVPIALLGNIIDSYSTLVDARLRSSTNAIARQSHRQQDDTAKRVLVGLLACSENPITPTAVVTSFRVIPASDVTPVGELVMPMVVETVVDLKIFGSMVTVNIVASGTIQATLGTDLMLRKAEIVLDTVALLQSMMKQARLAVRKAIALASDMATKLLLPSSVIPERPVNIKSSFSDLQQALAAAPGSNNHYRPLKKRLGSRNSLMPPPPSRPSTKSIADMTSSAGDNKVKEPAANAVWDAAPNMRAAAAVSGLSLLSAAISRNKESEATKEQEHQQPQEQQPTSKRPRSGSMESATASQRVASCPRLETSA